MPKIVLAFYLGMPNNGITEQQQRRNNEGDMEAKQKAIRILIESAGSSSGKAKTIQRVVKDDERGKYVHHKGRKAYLVPLDGDPTTPYKVDYWM